MQSVWTEVWFDSFEKLKQLFFERKYQKVSLTKTPKMIVIKVQMSNSNRQSKQ